MQDEYATLLEKHSSFSERKQRETKSPQSDYYNMDFNFEVFTFTEQQVPKEEIIRLTDFNDAGRNKADNLFFAGLACQFDLRQYRLCFPCSNFSLIFTFNVSPFVPDETAETVHPASLFQCVSDDSDHPPAKVQKTGHGIKQGCF